MVEVSSTWNKAYPIFIGVPAAVVRRIISARISQISYWSKCNVYSKIKMYFFFGKVVNCKIKEIKILVG